MCLFCDNVSMFFKWLWDICANLNMCIMSCNQLCFVGSQKTSFITAHGVGMKFSVCYNVLKS
jgi:hypothetical protein